VFIERIRAIGLRNLLALSALLAAGVLVFTNPAGADDPDFAPTITLQTSTTRAAAHPDARITVDNSNSNEQIKDLTIDLPDGFMGSLNAAEQCSRTDAANESCPAASQIGTVVNYARVDNSDAVLRGKVYLTEALDNGEPSGVTGPSANPKYWDPAGMQIVVPGKIGGVDVGKVVVNARVQMHYGEINRNDYPPPTYPTDATGPVLGVRTVVTDVPRSITDSHNRTVNFSLKKMVVDLKSDQTSPYKPLLTNSSRCRTAQIAMTAESYSDTPASASQDYTTTQCEEVHVGDVESMSFVPEDVTGPTGPIAASSPFTFTQSVEFPDDQPSLDSMTLQLPPSIAANAPEFGTPLQQCPVANFQMSGPGGENIISNIGCPASAKAGSVEIETPLLPDPVIGDLLFADGSPIPYMGLWVDPTTDGTPADVGPNPAGVSFGIGGTPNSSYLADSCDTSKGACKGFSVNFQMLPDVPIKKITVIGDPSDRPASPTNLSGEFLYSTAATSLECQPQSDVELKFTSWVGWDPDQWVSTRGGSGVTPFEMKDCNTPKTTMVNTPPFGDFTTVNPPSLTYTNAQSATISCGVDKHTPVVSCNPTGGIGGGATYNVPAVLEPGVHHFFTRAPGPFFNYRAFAVPVEPPADTTAPVVTITDDPGATTADTTPSIEFTSDEDAFFQCALDDGPFLPCDSSVSTVAQAGTYTVTTALIPGDDVHTISVRPVDLGNNAGVVKTFSFKVEVPLDPTFDVDVSTSAARAHPTLDMTVTSGSHEDIKNLTLAMPNGFLGSLNGAATLCPVATATSGACTDASKVGTVDTEAIVDESTVRISGNVYMTEPIALGDPAGLVIDVHAKIQDVDDGHVIVPVRMVVRGEAQGIDSVATNLPTAIDPAAWGNSWDGPSEFDLRSITLKLRNNPGASQPLLTNPSDCGASSFAATFVGENSTTVSKSEPFQATGCGALSFAPNLSLKMVDSATGKVPGASTLTKRVNVDFTAEMATSPDGSALKNAVLTLPKPLTIDVGHLPYPCQPAEQQARACPASSAIGTASATSPLLREPLTGTVYVLKSETSLPRMLIAMRGRINLDIIADNSFVNVNQIVTTFSAVPDAPLSNFTMNVQKFLMTRDWTCTETKPADWNVLGTLGAYSGASAPVNIPLKFDCPSTGAKPSVKVRFSGSGRKFTARVYATAPSGKRITKATVSLPRGVKLKRSVYRKASAMHRYVPVLADHRPLRVQCYGRRSATSFEVDTRKKSAKRIKVRFKRGALVVSRKFTRKHPPKFKVKVTLKSDTGKTSTATVSARVYYRGLRAANRRKLVARTSVKPC
jgi:hypothetical protein